MASRGDGRACF